MIDGRIKTYGTIVFDVEDKTTKHKLQSSWKKTAFVLIDDDSCEYYSWFLRKRYNIILNNPIRSSHVSFINDSMNDLTQNGQVSEIEALKRWGECKEKWDGKEIEIVLDLDIKTDSNFWWLDVPNDERKLLHSIRAEIGLSKPFFGLHMSIGRVREMIQHIEHSKYIYDCIKNGFID